MTTPLLYLLVDVASPYLIANLVAIGSSTLLRFAVAESVTWKARPAGESSPIRTVRLDRPFVR